MRKRTAIAKRAPLPKETVEHFAKTWVRHIPWAMENSKDVKDKPPPQYADAKAKRSALLKASLTARHALDELECNAAAGDESAMRMLVTFLTESVDWLSGVGYRQPELVRKIARERYHWPVLCARHPQFERDRKSYLVTIQLGEDCQRYSKSKQWGKGWGGKFSVATLWAEGLRATIEANRSHLELARKIAHYEQLDAEWRKIPKWATGCLALPPLTKDTAPQWFEIGWQAILEHTNGKPEDVPELRALGQHRAGKYARRYVKALAGRTSADILRRKESPERTAADDIRDGIKQRIRDALLSMAHKSSP